MYVQMLYVYAPGQIPAMEIKKKKKLQCSLSVALILNWHQGSQFGYTNKEFRIDCCIQDNIKIFRIFRVAVELHVAVDKHR